MKTQSITSLPAAPAADRGHRMLEYTIMMSIRVLCLISLLWVRGWWILIPAAGAVFLPYFAVVVANVARARPAAPERPGGVVRLDGVPESPRPEAERPEGQRSEAQSPEAPTSEQGADAESSTGAADASWQSEGSSVPSDAPRQEPPG
jgi:hypothetical protein